MTDPVEEGVPCVWAMRYVDALKLRTDEDEETAAYFSHFGFDKLTVPETATYVTSGWERIVQRFNQRYYFRRIGNETMERWQIRLQNKFDEVVDEMDRAYSLYATTTQINEVVKGTKTTYGHTITAGGQDTHSSTNNQRFADTPDGAVNEDDDYADRRSEQSGSTTITYGNTKGMTGNDKVEVLGPEVLAGVNKSIRDWTDIDTLFISQFEDNFLNIFD